MFSFILVLILMLLVLAFSGKPMTTIKSLLSVIITDNIRALFRSKPWQMGNSYHSLGGTCGRAKQLQKWKEGIHSTWKLTISGTEVNSQLLQKRNSN